MNLKKKKKTNIIKNKLIKIRKKRFHKQNAREADQQMIHGHYTQNISCFASQYWGIQGGNVDGSSYFYFCISLYFFVLQKDTTPVNLTSPIRVCFSEEKAKNTQLHCGLRKNDEQFRQKEKMLCIKTKTVQQNGKLDVIMQYLN